MKILFSITYFTPYVSGLTIYVERQVNALIKKGHTVTVLAMQHEHVLPRREKHDGVNIVRAVPLVKLSKGFLSLDWFLQSYKEVRHVDCVVINLPQVEGWIVAVFGRLLRKRVISVYHCEVNLPKTPLNYFIQRGLEWANRLSLLLSDRIIAYTDDYARGSTILRPFLSKTTAILPPVPKPQIDQAVLSRLKKQIGKENTLCIGIAARLASEKGVEYLLAAVPSIQTHFPKKNVKVVFAGPLSPVGEEAYKQKIFSLVEEQKDHIIFLGSLSWEEIGAFYELVDVLVLPSVNATEAFGLVQVEAMLCGTPVVASNLPGVRVPIQTTGMGIVVPAKRSDALSEAIVKIIENPRHYTKPPHFVSEMFSYQTAVDAFEQQLFVS